MDKKKEEGAKTLKLGQWLQGERAVPKAPPNQGEALGHN